MDKHTYNTYTGSNNNVTVAIPSDIQILLVSILVLHTVTVSVQTDAYRKPVQSGAT